MRPLNSDQLGALGEATFENLCTQAGLVCNKATRDRTGWDFSIEFPSSAPILGPPIDRLPSHPEYRVQVKAIWEGGNRVRLRLSSAERLAKSILPACIFVLCYRNDRTISSIYVIHLLNAPLEEILKQVRLSQKNGEQINKKYIHFKFDSIGVRIGNSGDAIFTALKGLVRDDIHSYAQAKTAQVRGNGFSENSFHGKFTLTADSKDDLSDITLGLKRAEIKDISIYDKRWGISLPLASNGGTGELEFKPHPQKGELIARSKYIKSSVSLKVNIIASNHRRFKALSLPFRILIFNDYFKAELNQSKLKFNIIGYNPDSNMRLSDHIRISKFLNAISQGDSTLILRVGEVKISIPISECNLGFDRNWLDSHRSVLHELQYIAEQATASDPYISLSAIDGQVSTIRFLYTIVTDSDSENSIKFSVKLTDTFPQSLEISDCLITGRIILYEMSIGFCASIPISIERRSADVCFQQNGEITLREITEIGPNRPDMDRFDQEMRQESEMALHIKLDLDLYDHAF